jgi:hypothetical protein
MDFDSVTKNQIVGFIAVAQAELLQMNGERVTLDLIVPEELEHRLTKRGKRNIYSPKLNIRCRRATAEDKEFIKQLNNIKRSKKEGIHENESFVAPTKNSVGLFRREFKKIDGVTLQRVKPYPDPTRPEEETKWMDQTAIDIETIRSSYEWVEAGNGTLGKMYVEVLKCDGLPNMDTKLPTTNEKGFTDAFCCLIYEDAIVNTDVIRDDLNPRWVPWSQRAFVFRMHHPSSQLLIGVFVSTHICWTFNDFQSLVICRF